MSSRPRARSSAKNRCGLPIPATACTGLPRKAASGCSCRGSRRPAVPGPPGAASAGLPQQASAARHEQARPRRRHSPPGHRQPGLGIRSRAAVLPAAAGRCRSRAPHRSRRSRSRARMRRCCRPSSARMTFAPRSASARAACNAVARDEGRAAGAPSEDQRLIADLLPVRSRRAPCAHRPARVRSRATRCRHRSRRCRSWLASQIVSGVLPVPPDREIADDDHRPADAVRLYPAARVRCAAHAQTAAP